MKKNNISKTIFVVILFFLLTGCGRLSKEINNLPNNGSLEAFPPQNLRALEGNQKIILVWDNPNDIDFNGVIVKRSIAGDAGLQSSMLNDDGHYLPPEGTALPEKDLINGQTYEYRVWAKNSNGNYSSTLIHSATPVESHDTIPPSKVASIRAINIADKVFLNWDNPSDSDFLGVIVVRKKDGYPENIDDGVTVYVGDRDAFTDDKVDKEQTYYYSIFAFDESLNFSESTNIVVSVRNQSENEFRINTNLNGDQRSPAVNYLSNGNFVVAALDRIAGDFHNIILNIFDESGNRVVSEKKLILQNTTERCIPNVVDIGNDYFVLTWESYDNIFAQIFDYKGNQVSNEFRVNGTLYQDYDQSDQVVASLGEGKFVIAWESEGWDSDRKAVVFKVFSFNDGVLSVIKEETRANQFWEHHQKDPAISALNNGNFVIVWETKHRRKQTGGYDISGRVFSSYGNALTNEFWVNEGAEYYRNDQKWVSVGTLSDGSFVVSWVSGKAESVAPQDLSVYGIFSRRAYYSGNNVVFSPINKVNSIEISDFEYEWDEKEFELDFNAPQVLGLSAGGYMIAWDNPDALDGQGYSVRAQRYAFDNSKIGSEYQVNDNGKNDQKKPKLTLMENGDVFIVWQSDQDSKNNQNIWGKHERI